MDGNGRWAAERGLPRLAGHEEGSKAVGQALSAASDAGVKILTLYAFSSENWKRPKEEVAGLMNLLQRFLEERTREIMERNICLRTIGHIEELPSPCLARLQSTVAASKSNTGLQVVLALNYSSRREITDAVRRIAREVQAGRLSPESIEPTTLAAHLDTRDLPDPDLLIRTSGEFRLSNFLLWQLSYTEIHVTQKLWPDFTQQDFQRALHDFASRERRFGGLGSSNPTDTSVVCSA
jgi:undecaprenyl diphosphate synthase